MMSENQKDYIIDLNTKRSKRALIAALVVSLCTFIAVTRIAMDQSWGKVAFRYFTNLANLLSAMGAMFMIPYAVEGIRKKRFTMPRWISLFQYAGAVSVFITMFCASTIITFTLGPKFAFEGPQIWLHLIIPVLAIVLFLAVENGQILTRKDTVIAQIPFWIYAFIYFVMVILVGEKNGGWDDMYETTSRLPIWVVLILLLSIGYGAAVFLRIIHNRAVKKSMAQIAARWEEDISPIEFKIEAYGLGRYMARRLDESEIVIPMDLLRLMTEKCDVTLDELVRAYSMGVAHGMREAK